MQLDDYKEGVKLYNAQNASDQFIKTHFVIRLKEYKKIWCAIASTNKEVPEQNYLIQGVRGAGKTTLLRRLAIELAHSDALNTWLLPVTFKEEEYGISSLFTLWERVAEELEEHYHDQFAGLLDGLDAIAGQDPDPKAAIQLLSERLKKQDKRVVLFIDNLVELFENFNRKETEILREVLTTNPYFRLIGGSAVSLEAFYDNQAPFYQFFEVINLAGLDKPDTEALLRALASHSGEREEQRLLAILEQEPQRIESIRRLTGGIPRTLVILFNILMEGANGQTYALLEETIDRTTPLYKHRMDDLAPQQKPIVNAIALHWDAISAKEIAEKTRLPSKNISAQLSQLEKNWVIEKIKTDGKNNLYRIKERFFNIWYLMRYGRRRDKNRVLWLTRFMEVWCVGDELKHRSQSFLAQLTGPCHPQATLTFANALLCSDQLEHTDKQQILEQTQRYLSSAGHTALSKELIDITDVEGDKNKQILIEWLRSDEPADMTEAVKNAFNAISVEDIWLIAMAKEKENKPNKLLTFAEALQERSPINALTIKGFIYFRLGKNTDAEVAFKQITDIEPENTTAAIILASIYRKSAQWDKAIAALQAAQSELESRHTGYYHRVLGEIYLEGGEYDLSEQYFLSAQGAGEPVLDMLGCLNVFKANLSQAIDYFEQYLSNNGDSVVYSTLTLCYYYQADPINKSAALQYAKLGVENNPSLESTAVLIQVMLWNNLFQDATQAMDALLSQNDGLDSADESLLTDLFVAFLAKGQTNLVERWFEQCELKERFKPIYYALMTLMQDKYPNEVLKMGEELKETVDEVLTRIEDWSVKYA
ncbi:AAA family ATPase [Pseudoalteromonas viridis]|uniref:Tetratricopeptide repeat protein n=1 Tax=Pseudoalteromonas viridis TaxID=339617 RepID=A0ABX7VAT9_9GAMM|nr:tetratricopeptide repeat protein [Pseudoalteromonas viridis]QTL35748.1 tetratricopeptide repeat protein [Pseudoalteromonas viridis]